MLSKVSRRLRVVLTAVALAIGVGVMAIPSASATQSGSINNIGCTTNTYIYIKTRTTGTTWHFWVPKVGATVSWSKGYFALPTDSKTATGRSAAAMISGSGDTLVSIAYTCSL